MLRYLGFRKSFDIGQLVEKKLVEKKASRSGEALFWKKKGQGGKVIGCDGQGNIMITLAKGLHLIITNLAWFGSLVVKTDH